MARLLEMTQEDVTKQFYFMTLDPNLHICPTGVNKVVFLFVLLILAILTEM